MKHITLFLKKQLQRSNNIVENKKIIPKNYTAITPNISRSQLRLYFSNFN